MANTLGIDYSDDLCEQIADAGQRVKIGSRWINCIASDERRTAQIEDEAAIEVYEREVILVSDNLSAIPQQNSTAVIGSTRYFVCDVQNDPEEVSSEVDSQHL